MTDSVAPFEEMKLRLLNGAHSALAYLGLLLGHETVAAAFGDAALRRFIDGLWAESAETLPRDAGLNPMAYAGELARRFGNPALAHRLAQIANDGSQKLPQRILAPLRARAEAGRPTVYLTMPVAAWIAACEARGAALQASRFGDPLDAGLNTILAEGAPPRETVAAVFRLAGFDRDESLEGAVAAALTVIREQGVAAALDAVFRRLPA